MHSFNTKSDISKITDCVGLPIASKRTQLAILRLHSKQPNFARMSANGEMWIAAQRKGLRVLRFGARYDITNEH